MMKRSISYSTFSILLILLWLRYWTTDTSTIIIVWTVILGFTCLGSTTFINQLAFLHISYSILTLIIICMRGSLVCTLGSCLDILASFNRTIGFSIATVHFNHLFRSWLRIWLGRLTKRLWEVAYVAIIILSGLGILGTDKLRTINWHYITTIKHIIIHLGWNWGIKAANFNQIIIVIIGKIRTWSSLANLLAFLLNHVGF